MVTKVFRRNPRKVGIRVNEGSHLYFSQHRPWKCAGKGDFCGGGNSHVAVHIVFGGERDAAFVGKKLGLSRTFKFGAGNASRLRTTR